LDSDWAVIRDLNRSNKATATTSELVTDKAVSVVEATMSWAWTTAESTGSTTLARSVPSRSKARKSGILSFGTALFFFGAWFLNRSFFRFGPNLSNSARANEFWAATLGKTTVRNTTEATTIGSETAKLTRLRSSVSFLFSLLLLISDPVESDLL